MFLSQRTTHSFERTRPLLPTPTTRASLLLRLKDHDDQEAWNEFLEIYQPILYRMARRRGYQDADSREIVQNVLVAITKNISTFAPRHESGAFRAWLSTMVKNQTINLFERQSKLRSVGGSDFRSFRIPASRSSKRHRARPGDGASPPTVLLGRRTSSENKSTNRLGNRFGRPVCWQGAFIWLQRN